MFWLDHFVRRRGTDLPQPRRQLAFMDLDIVLNRAAPAVLSHQIGRAIIDLIAGGALVAGNRLPATRDLARQLSVARMTVVDAYGWLAEQGYVAARQGSGTVVRDIPLSISYGRKAVRAPGLHRAAPESARNEFLTDFRPGLPDLASFPRRQWISALTCSGRTLPASCLGYGDPLGHERLRHAIAGYLQRSRGLAVDPRNVVITAGAAQGVDIVLRAVSRLREVVIEAPGPHALRTLPAHYPVSLREVPVDEQGLRTDSLPKARGIGRCAYVIPSHHLPLGCSMSLERRLALLAWAGRTDTIVIEDDYDSEFAFNGRPSVPLARLDRGAQVIYAGTFSKTLAPALRIGFMVVPDRLLAKIAGLKWWADRGGWMLQQDALAAWLEQGVFERHVQRMRKVYGARFVALTATLSTRLGSRVRLLGQPVGMHLAALVRTRQPVGDLCERARARGVMIYPIDGVVLAASREETAFIFGFGNVAQENVERGAAIFADVVLSGP